MCDIKRWRVYLFYGDMAGSAGGRRRTLFTGCIAPFLVARNMAADTAFMQGILMGHDINRSLLSNGDPLKFGIFFNGFVPIMAFIASLDIVTYF